ncbi:hypothetical protein BaRGS_00030052, partial [Batillaria attramentaria]
EGAEESVNEAKKNWFNEVKLLLLFFKSMSQMHHARRYIWPNCDDKKQDIGKMSVKYTGPSLLRFAPMSRDHGSREVVGSILS